MKHNIDQILEKYWEGESSVEDENTLKRYFTSDQIDMAHEPFKDLFGWMVEFEKIANTVTLDIDALLDKYWEGETSVKEEEMIQAYFKSKNIAESHLPFAALFEYFDEQSQVKYQELPSKHIIETQPATKVTQLNIKKWLYAAAAATVLVLGSIFVVNNLKQEKHSQQFANINEIEDPEEALRVTKEALALVSKKFRKSQQSVQQNMGALEKASIFK